MIYYFMLLCAAALFSVQFLFQQRFEETYGTDLKSALVFSAVIDGAGHADAMEANPGLYWSTVENFINKYI